MADVSLPSDSLATGPAAVAGDSPTARRRREEVVQAAAEIIVEEGLHRLSLSRIEARAKMSRGQLTYYFPTKEAILLAVFDRVLTLMIAAAGADEVRRGVPSTGPSVAFARVQFGLSHLLGPDHLCHHSTQSTLGPLVHTFMAQAAHRPDYRTRLAEANAAWRTHIAHDVAAARPPEPDPQAIASVIMALFQGLGDQLAVDPQAFNREAVLRVCLKLMTPLISPVFDDSEPTHAQ